MKRRLINAAAMVSLVVCVATIALWARSHLEYDVIVWRKDTAAYQQKLQITSGIGIVNFDLFRMNTSVPRDAFGSSYPVGMSWRTYTDQDYSARSR